MVDTAACRLLGGHVFGRADDVAMGGVGHTTEQLGDPEVGELHPFADRDVVGEEDVGRLQVAVDDPMIVRHLQGPGDRKRHRDGFLPGEPAAGAEGLFDRLPAYQLHREVRLVPLLPEGEELDDAGVPQVLEGVDLGAEAGLQPLVVGEVGREHLDGDGRAGDRVDGFIDRTHPATAEPGADGVRSEPGWFHRGCRGGEKERDRRWTAGKPRGRSLHSGAIGYNCRTGSFHDRIPVSRTTSHAPSRFPENPRLHPPPPRRHQPGPRAGGLRPRLPPSSPAGRRFDPRAPRALPCR